MTTHILTKNSRVVPVSGADHAGRHTPDGRRVEDGTLRLDLSHLDDGTICLALVDVGRTIPNEVHEERHPYTPELWARLSRWVGSVGAIVLET